MSQEKERLLARKEKIEQRLADLEKAESRRREKDEERKAVLAGRAVLARARKDQDFAGRLRLVFEAEITGARARALFGLPHGKGSASAKAGMPEAGAGQADTAGPAQPDSGPLSRTA